MFQELVAAIADWPVLLQGAIGSGLFLLVLRSGQRATSYVSEKYSESSRARRKAYLLEQLLKYHYKTVNDTSVRGAIFSALTYRAFRNFIRALVWMVLGLLGGTILGTLAVIGYLGALYYLFSALSTVTPAPDSDDPAGKIAELNAELAEIKSDA
mgnify:CR=1 FL=1